METYIIIGVLAGIILLLLLVGAPIKPVRFIGQGVIKLMIGALFLFFLNAFGNYIGIHVPINFVTTAVSGFLGIPGVAALVIIQMYII
ncbi:pro-sigmaK processing inhibitor BofA family protein [Sutcliffiella cohnii]|uniref:Transcriptional regulator n=1 Tax=Sutcliffiella cohnii TaxID=33932 RepID=A0A223KWV1_9BACI|nr:MULTISPECIES: pro-sigmaK processing inhibitor BofA family protein [Sutcliffiella]AST93955.1 transcriptional regulator [Sutcliffiella cohnii]MED4018456.1 pro-sigmaK processing inhibitor BofA family protein [Sutcliffiella cohnii]WBL15158.1 pro-sigmaK processing inhibitor BofA family protein [Sutcliffiella sp. NC1]